METEKYLEKNFLKYTSKLAPFKNTSLGRLRLKNFQQASQEI